MFRFLKSIRLPRSNRDFGRIPTAQDMITYKDMNTWSI